MDREIKRKYPNLRKIMVIMVPSVVIIALLSWALSRTGESVYSADRISILYGDVVEGDFNDYIRVTGKVESGTVVQVSALETGIVEKKWLEEGSYVKEGDILLTLRNPNLQQQILDSESQLAERQNMLRDTEIAMQREGLQLHQDLMSAQVEEAQARRELEAQSTLYDRHFTARETYLMAKENYDLVCGRLRLIRERISQDSMYRNVQITMMQESLGNMMHNLSLVRQRADNLNIKASHGGQLGSLDVELGQNISAGMQVGQINVLDNYKIMSQIDEHYIERVVTGLTGTMERNGSVWDVKVTKVYPEVAGGQFRTDFVFDPVIPDNIRVGQTCYINLRLGDPVKAVMVPRGSFFQTTGGHWVYVLSDDGKSARKRDIKIGRQNPQYYEVLEGLVPGERIILSSYAEYGEADRVVIR